MQQLKEVPIGSIASAFLFSTMCEHALDLHRGVVRLFLYRGRNAIERMFCRLKDFPRVATSYDRNAGNFLAVCIAATSAEKFKMPTRLCFSVLVDHQSP